MRVHYLLSCTLAVVLGSGCGQKSSREKAAEPKSEKLAQSSPALEVPKPPEAKPAQVRRGLVLALAQFDGAKPKPARFELLTPRGAQFVAEGVEDPDSNVFHKVLALPGGDGPLRLVSLGGSKAAVKVFRRAAQGFQSETLWTESFGGKFDRMRDAELGDVDGDGALDIVVGTHDQGVVAYLHEVKGAWQVERLDRKPDTFIHEIELGDLNGDGVLEIYATPSEPNRLDAGEQSGQVVRYVPKRKEGRVVVADLKKRHAKEILVADLDGDGKDELYVAVEALTAGEQGSVRLVEPVEIRRYDEHTDKDHGKVVARIQDRYCRFLTAGDVDGDGKKELVAAAFRSGVWLLRPGQNGKDGWTVENIDANSSSFEHAALLTDLDEDGKDELYVAADEQGELRRYVWKNGKPVRDTILRRERPRETLTWNIMAVPLAR